jgi:hypothetical protein
MIKLNVLLNKMRWSTLNLLIVKSDVWPDRTTWHVGIRNGYLLNDYELIFLVRI